MSQFSSAPRYEPFPKKLDASHPNTRSWRILLVEDNVIDARLIQDALTTSLPYSMTIERAVSLSHARTILQSQRDFNCVLVDLGLPDGRGLDNLVQLKRIAPELTYIIMTAVQDEEMEAQAMVLGAQDYLIKGMHSGAEIWRLIRHAISRNVVVVESESAREREHYNATHCPLTDLPNRRLFFSLAQERIEKFQQARRNADQLAVCMLDLDGFKKINDNFGHPVGDETLRQVSNVLRQNLRNSDIIARLAGDEFVLMIGPPISYEHVRLVASRVVNAISQIKQVFQYPVTLGASLGAAVFPNSASTLDDLMHYADKELYAAKSRGKGCFSIHADPNETT